MGLLAVAISDTVIAVAAIWGIVYVARGSGPSSNSPEIVTILSGGFTAIGTITTAYFGIKSISNTAQSVTRPAAARNAPPPAGDTANPS